ncbi:hypothetical protein P3T73_17795 [Kiritimatiellota bacterium B12222]|nr:hypothetical protein P3T73_17795 [Kiritimatiellota bacterium B12222]
MDTNALQHRSHPWTWKTWTSLGGLLIFMVVLLPFGLFISPIWDIPPVDDSMMWVTPDPIPDEQNARFILEQASTFLLLPEDTWVEEMLKNPQSYRQEIEGWVRYNQEFYDRWDQAVVTRPYQGPWDIESNEDLTPLMKQTNDMGNALLFRASLLPSQAERVSAYIDLLHTFITFGEAEYTLYNRWRWAFTFTKIINQIRQDFDSQAPTAKVLTTFKATLPSRYPLTNHQKKWMIIHAYQQNISILNQANTNEDIYSLFYDTPHLNSWKQRQFFYQPQRTRALQLEMSLHELHQYDPDQFPSSYRDTETIYFEEHFSSDKFWGLFSAFNEMGKDFLQNFQVTDAVHYSERTQKSNEGFLAQLHIQAALHLYRMDHGQFPTSLSELVPAYLDHIPLDPYGKGEMKYLPQAGIIYSVGRDEHDDNGEPGEDNCIFIRNWLPPLGTR